MSNYKANRSPTSGDLRFTTEQLFGRDNEVRMLKEALVETSEGKGHPGVCVSGYAGTGKSSLVRHSLRVKEEGSQYVFVEGRFDEMCSHRPYSAIVAALNQLCQTLGETDVENLKDRLQEDEILILTNFIPALKAKFGKDSQEEFGRDTNWGVQRLQDSVKGLLESIAETRSVVMFLDGLQWADEESLKLLSSVFLESSIPRLLFVVALREDEIRNDILSSIVDNEALLAIRTTNLNQTCANNYLSRVLQRDSESTMDLAEVIHRKTYGNIYFMIQFLKCLQQGKMLFFSLLSNKWEWDLQKITSETTLTDNVADMVTGRLRLLPLETQTALQIASCIGYRFDATVLGQQLDHWSENPKLTEAFALEASQRNDSVDIAHVLESSCRDDLLEHTQVMNTELRVYQFSHNRVQEAAYNSIGDSADQAEYHVKIGRLLWRIYNSSKEQDWMLLLAVDQLDRSIELLDGEPEEVALARMNLEASDKVCSTWAFAAAAGYARASLRLLGENKWEKYYETTLAASTLSCEMEYCCGNFERVRCVAAEVLAFAQDIDEKFPVLLKEVQCLSSLQQHREASKTARSTLSELGRSFSVPGKPSIRHIVFETIKVKRLMRGLSDSDILNYQICTDARAEKAIHMMSALIRSAWIAQDTDMFAFVSLRLMRISLICGRTIHFALAMSSYSILTLYLRDYERGNRYGILSVKISNLYKSNFARVDSNMLHHAFCHHLHSPYQQSLEPLLQGYRLGMSVSNVESAHSSIVLYLACYFCSGLPLGSMVKDSKAFFDEMLPYNHLTLLTLMAAQRQFALNLTDTQKIPNWRIKGEAVDELKEKAGVCLDAHSEMTEVPIMFFEMLLAYFLGEGKWATSRAKQYRRKMDEDFPVLMSLTFPFYRSLIWIEEIRLGNRRYWWLLRRDLKLMRSWVKRGFVNCHHMLQIIEAEAASLGKKQTQNEIRKLYEKAINVASRSGFNHNAALTCELYGAHLQRVGDMEESQLQLRKSVHKYTEWNAYAKVAQMARRYDGIEVSGRSSELQSTARNLHGRERHEEVHQDTNVGDWISKASVHGSIIESSAALGTSGQNP